MTKFKNTEHELLINDFEKETENLRKQIKQERDARKRFAEAVKELIQELAYKEQEIEDLRFMERNIFPLVENLGDKVEQDKINFLVERLKKVKGSILDFSNGYWRYFAKNGEEYMKSSDLESCLQEYIDNQIEELKKGVK